MSDTALLEPWEQAQQAQMPMQAPPPTMEPWEAAQASSQSRPFPEPQTVDQKGLQDVSISDAMTAYGAGQLAKLGVQGGTAAVQGIGSLFETPESLKSAGITANTIGHMAPTGQNPADYANAVEKQLQSNDALGTTAKETWDKMNSLKQKAGQAIGDILQKIKSAESTIDSQFGDIGNPTIVDAQKSLQPLSEKISEMGTGVYSGTQLAAKPFQEAYQGLMGMAEQQGGKLSLDNIDTVLKETGEMMDKGEEASSLYGPVYGRLADVRDSMVNSIAQQSNNPELAQTLLKNNADYSTYMRLLPSVEKAGYKEAIKEGVSAYRKYGGPLVAKLAAGYGIGKGIQEAIDKVMGSGK